MTKHADATARIQEILNAAADDGSPAVLRMAEMMLEMNNTQAKLAVEAMDRLQKESTATRELVRDVMLGKLAIFNLPTARQYANLSTGRSAGGSSASAVKSSPGAGGPATFEDEDRTEERVSDEEVLRDIDPTGQRGGHGVVPPR